MRRFIIYIPRHSYWPICAIIVIKLRRMGCTENEWERREVNAEIEKEKPEGRGQP